ncbi:aromatic-ring-hydroxylating dioxygenase subunit beta [uncultured Pseudacidovorax sp.]|uniref:aromatic-ring-hydroxylating dioxygenase subunit beta n=1 Tax=uncultured Pseudacidovorax sp. TaxID=679313 RepID=UPI0025D30412|nr:aromatic-ring-hydroxylating dioxygenase subunit beta [uncultured Pseudacidovorax sp.]
MNTAQAQVLDLQLRYAHAVDDDALEQWPGFFTPQGRYRVIPRENHARGLPACLIDCQGVAMMQDRVVSLRTANIYNIHFDRHLMSPPLVAPADGDGLVRARTQFLVIQSDQAGVSKPFAAGVYLDLVDLRGPQPLFAERTVVLDSYGVQELLATPI